jgi:hypothetical protein
VYFVQPRSEIFWNCEQIFGSAAEKCWKCDQKHCILFSRAEKSFGFATKSSVICSAAQRKIVELRPKALLRLHFVQPRTEEILNCEQKHFFVQPRCENFGIATKSTLFCSAAQRKFLNCEQTSFGIATKALHFVQPRSENILEL